MNLQDMLDLAAKGGPLHVEEGWGQGRATYGGLVSALQLAAIRGGHEGGLPPLRSLTTSFVAPVVPGEAEVETTLLRAGKSVTQYQATLRQGERVGAAVLASFGTERTSSLRVHPSTRMPQLPDPMDIEPHPHVPGATPDFFQHVDLRQVGGRPPYSGSDSSSMTGWMRLKEPGETFGEEHLVALADAWPPAPVQMLREPAPGSTLTWTLEIVGDMQRVDPRSQWAYAVHTDAAQDGYGHTEARIWRPHGTLMAISRQTVAVFG